MTAAEAAKAADVPSVVAADAVIAATALAAIVHAEIATAEAEIEADVTTVVPSIADATKMTENREAKGTSRSSVIIPIFKLKIDTAFFLLI
jgi:hypothetical protein